MMMILGFAVSAPLAGHFLDPFSNARLIEVTASVAAVAFAISGARRLGRREAGVPAMARARPPRRHASFLARARRDLARARGPPVHDLHLRLDARLRRAGAADRALRRPRLRHDSRIDDEARRPPARRRPRRAWSASRSRPPTIGGPVLGSLRLWTMAGCAASAASLAAIAASGLLAARARRLPRVRLRARPVERRLRGGGDRLDDGPRRRRRRLARRNPHGALGRRAGHRLRRGRRRGDRSRRPRTRPSARRRSSPTRSCSASRRRSSSSRRRSPGRSAPHPAHAGLAASGAAGAVGAILRRRAPSWPTMRSST